MADTDIATEKASVDDRLTVMLVLAGLFHLIVILGVSFSVASQDDKGAVPTLEVLLVSDALPESLRNDQARYLSQRTQQGAGNTQDSSRSKMPTPSNSPIDSPGEYEGRPLQDAVRGPTGGESAAVTSSGEARRARYMADGEQPVALAPDTPRQLLAGAETNLPSAEDDAELNIKGPARRELLVTPSTRESGAAVYMDAWRRKVERVGTLNFPNQARRKGMTGNPVVEVALAADGRLMNVRVRRSSGYPELDQAAIEILRLSTPFEPFSRELARRYDVLRFAYEWQFVGGQLRGSAVQLPAGTR
jgi:protein TonB